MSIGLMSNSDMLTIEDVSLSHLIMEDCANGLDDDDDGLIDLNDPDCICEVLSQESLIPNPSFEETTCCPVERSMLNCAVDWIQASEPTSDLIHACGWTGWNDHFPPVPFPDGEWIVGFANGRLTGANDFQSNWKEYVGACLTSPLKANTTYRFEFYIGFSSESASPAIDLTFYGTPDCTFLPFGVGDENFGCPTNGPNWKKLGSQNVSGGEGATWEQYEITITPDEDINAIVIGPPCAASTAGRTTYYFFDNLVLADLRSFEFRIAEVSHPCSDDFTLRVPEEEGVNYQWYKEGIALINEDNALLSANYGEGDYQVRIESEGECVLTQTFTYQIPVISEPSSLTICVNEVYEFGDQILTESGTYEMLFTSKDNCDSIVSLTLNVLPELEETINAKIFEGETFDGIETQNFNSPGIYEVSLINKYGCDSLVTLELDFYNVYFPNVFKPNYNTSTNDRFFVAGNDDLTEVKSMAIYDRWGTRVYNGQNEIQNESNGWDGMYNGKMADQGIYSYISKIEMNDGKEREFVGTVLLLK